MPTDREKIAEVLAELKAQVADIEAYLSDTDQPIDPDLGPPSVSAPSEVFAPSGQNVAWVPVTLSHAATGVALRVVRVQNASPATINVGNAASQARYLTDAVYRWSADDDLTQYVRLQLPGTSYRDGQQVIYHMDLTGAATGHLVVKVTFRDGAEHPVAP